MSKMHQEAIRLLVAAMREHESAAAAAEDRLMCASTTEIVIVKELESMIQQHRNTAFDLRHSIGSLSREVQGE